MTHHAANAAGLRPMTFGRAMHMDLSRASDEDLDRAYRVLDDYDNAGKASAYTQDMIDDRCDDINAEGDRRAGVEPATVERKPRSFWHPGTLDEGEEQAEPDALDPDDNGEPDDADPDFDADPQTVQPVQLRTRGQRRLYAALDAVAFDPAKVPALIADAKERGVDVSPFMPAIAVDGMVPGEAESL